MRLWELTDEHSGRIQLQHRCLILLPADRERRFTEYYLQHRQAARERYGLPYDLPPVGAHYPTSSMKALEAAKWVERHHPERFQEFDLSVFEAFFRETRDISDPEVLVELAERAGMPGALLAASLAEGTMRQQVWAEHDEAEARGVTAIPTACIDGRMLRGALPFEEYDRVLEAALTARGRT